MIVITPFVEILTPIDGEAMLKHIEQCGRLCYKSEDKITDDSTHPFIKGIIKRGHESVIEHVSVTVKFTCDRGVSHEIVRHRIASYSQESTRYCNYGNEKFNNAITVVLPTVLIENKDPELYDVWAKCCENAEETYFKMLDMNMSPQIARSVLPNSLKTELIMTANLREWRHFFKLRCSKAAHPDMRYVALQLLDEMKSQIPVIFDDIDIND